MRTLGKRKNGQPFTLRRSEWASHWHLVGGSGSGKSTAMLGWIRQLAVGRSGVMLIDPHGDLADDVLAWAAAVRLDRHKTIHVIEPRNADLCPAFNPLALDRTALETGVASIADAFGQVWDGEDMHAKPRLSRLLRNTLYVLAEHGLTLAEAQLVLAPEHKRLRMRLTSDLPNEYFRTEWAELHGLMASSARGWMEYSESVANRIAPFLSSPVINRIVGQSARSLDLAGAMARGDVVVVNLRTSPQFSEEDARLLAALLLNDVRLRAFQRPRDALPFHVFCDEATKYINSDVESMLVETRKRGVFLVLAHQGISGQLRALGESIYETVLAIPNRIAFGRISMKDATLIAEEMFAGTHDLQKAKEKHTTPVTVGYRPIWLESMSSATSHADFDGESEGYGESDGLSEPVADGEERAGDPPLSHRSTGASRSGGRSWGSTDSTTESYGMHEAMAPILEERATQLYTLQELQYEAAVRIKQLRTGLAIAKVDGRTPEHLAIPLPRPGLGLRSAELRMWKAHVLARSSSLTTTGVADREIAQRRQQLLGTPTIDVEDSVDLDQGVLLPARGTVKEPHERPRRKAK